MILLALSLSYLYLRYTKPLYQSTAVIQRSTQDEGKRVFDIEGFEEENKLSEDVELLRSPFLLEEALRNLNLVVSYYSEGDILTEEKYLLSPYHITLLELKDSSLIGKQIRVSKNGEKIRIEFDHEGTKQVSEFFPEEEVNTDFFRFYFKIDDPVLFERDLSENNVYFVFNDIKTLSRSMHPSLNVYALNEEARTIEIKFASNNPELANDVVSTLITTFFEYDLEEKSASSASILSFIDSQLDTVSTQLKDSENRIKNFKDSSRVSNPAVHTQNVMNRINDFELQLISVEYDISLILEVERVVHESNRLDIYNIIPVIAGSVYESLLTGELNKLHELLVQKEDAMFRETEATENYKRLTRSIETQTSNIFRIVEKLKDQLTFRQKNLQSQIGALQTELYDVPATEMELARLDRLYSLNEKYYTLLVEKKTEYAISKAGFTMDNKVLQEPSEAVLISPNRTLTFAGSLIISIFLSFLFLLVRYITFNDIHNPDELKKLLPSYVGFIGMLPKVVMPSKNSSLIVHQQPKSALAESYRHIRSNLYFVLDENKKNVIAVSSSISGEGKTFVTLNLAGIFAMMGKKVLVIDLDLRKPKLHHGFSVANNNGMSTILADKVDWRTCVNKSDIADLDFITAGPIPPNPSELILGGKLDAVIAEFKETYDFILIDNPPVGIVSDGIGVLSKADCAIYVLRANYSKRMFVHRVTDLIESKKIGKLFVLLNSVDSTRTGYGYAYGYSYGDYYTDETFGKKKWFKFFRT